MLDRSQELAIFQRLQEVGAGLIQFIPAFEQVPHQRIQAPGIHGWLAHEAPEVPDLVIEFLVHFAAYIASGKNGHDFQKTGYGSSGRPVGIALAVVQQLLVQELESQERSHTLIQGLLVLGESASDVWRRDLGDRFSHGGILRQAAIQGK